MDGGGCAELHSAIDPTTPFAEEINNSATLEKQSLALDCPLVSRIASHFHTYRITFTPIYSLTTLSRGDLSHTNAHTICNLHICHK